MSFIPPVPGMHFTAKVTGGEAGVPREALILAEALMPLHGDVRWAMERSGLHLYMASPEALKQDGQRELAKMHMAINVSKHLGLDSWATKRGTYDADLTAYCMKYRKPYRVSELLKMAPLARRGIEMKREPRLQGGADHSMRMVTDENGNTIPEMPTDVTPIIDLPDQHPAVVYLRSRGYDVHKIWEQYSAVFCNNELPEDRAVRRFYSNLPGGWKITPKFRIIFQAIQEGVRVGWQARIIEHDAVQDGVRMRAYLHPYTGMMEWCEFKRPSDEKFQPLEHLTNSNFKWDMVKYITATGMSRAKSLMGFDAAKRFNAQRGGNPFAIVTEGPLDSARFGPPAMPIIGQYLSEEQAELLIKNFHTVFFVPDNDRAGNAAILPAAQLLVGKVPRFVVAKIPPEWTTRSGGAVKDAGDMSPEQLAEFVSRYKIPL